MHALPAGDDRQTYPTPIPTIDMTQNRPDTLDPFNINSNTADPEKNGIILTQKIPFQSDQHVSIPANFGSQSYCLKNGLINQAGPAKCKKPLQKRNKKFNKRTTNSFSKHRRCGTNSMHCKESVGDKSQRKGQGYERSRIRGDVSDASDSEKQQLEFYVSHKSLTNKSNTFLTKSCQDLTKLKRNYNVQRALNVCNKTRKESDEYWQEESVLLDKLSDVAICNDILVNDKKKENKPYRTEHNSHLYTFDNLSIADLNEWTGRLSAGKSHRTWSAKDENYPAVIKNNPNDKRFQGCFNEDISLPSSPCDTQFLLKTFLNTEPESEIEYQLKDPIHALPCTPNTSSGSQNSKQNILRLNSGRPKTCRRVKLESPAISKGNKFDVIIQHNGVVKGNGSTPKPETKNLGSSDFYRESEVFLSQSDLPSQYVLLQSAKLRYYEKYIQSMRPKTPQRHKWYGSASFGQERCPCCTPALRPRNAPIRINERCSSSFCCQNLRLHPRSRTIPSTPEYWINSSKSDDLFVPKRLSKSASYSEGRDIFRIPTGSSNNGRRNKNDFIVKRGKRFEPLEVKSLDVEDVFQVNHDFQNNLDNDQTVVQCPGKRLCSTEVKIIPGSAYVRAICSPRSSSTRNKAVRFEDGCHSHKTEKSAANTGTVTAQRNSSSLSNGISEESSEWKCTTNNKIYEITDKHMHVSANEIVVCKSKKFDARKEVLEPIDDSNVRHQPSRKYNNREIYSGEMYDCISDKDDSHVNADNPVREITERKGEDKGVLLSEDSLESNISEVNLPQSNNTDNNDDDNNINDNNDIHLNNDKTKGKITKEDSIDSTISLEDSSSKGPQVDMRQLLDLKPCMTGRKYSSESIPTIIMTDEEGNENELELDDNGEDDDGELKKSDNLDNGQTVCSSLRSGSTGNKTVRFEDGCYSDKTEKSTTNTSTITAQRNSSSLSNGISKESSEWKCTTNNKIYEITDEHMRVSANEIVVCKSKKYDTRKEVLEPIDDSNERHRLSQKYNREIYSGEMYDCISGEDDSYVNEDNPIREITERKGEDKGVLLSEDSLESNTSEVNSSQSNNTDNNNDNNDIHLNNDKTKSKITKEDSMDSTISPQYSSSKGPQMDMRQLLDLKPCMTGRKYSSESIPTIITTDEEGNENELEPDHLDDHGEDDDGELEKSEEPEEEDDEVKETENRRKINRRPKTGLQRSVKREVRWQEIKDDPRTVGSDQELLAPDSDLSEVQSHRVKKKVKKVKTEVHPQIFRKKGTSSWRTVNINGKNSNAKVSLKDVNYYCSPEFWKMKLTKKVVGKMKQMGVIQEHGNNTDNKQTQMAAPKIVVTGDMSNGNGTNSREEEEVTKQLNAGMLAVPENCLVSGDEQNSDDEESS